MPDKKAQTNPAIKKLLIIQRWESPTKEAETSLIMNDSLTYINEK